MHDWSFKLNLRLVHAQNRNINLNVGDCILDSTPPIGCPMGVDQLYDISMMCTWCIHLMHTWGNSSIRTRCTIIITEQDKVDAILWNPWGGIAADSDTELLFYSDDRVDTVEVASLNDSVSPSTVIRTSKSLCIGDRRCGWYLTDMAL